MSTPKAAKSGAGCAGCHPLRVGEGPTVLRGDISDHGWQPRHPFLTCSERSPRSRPSGLSHQNDTPRQQRLLLGYGTGTLLGSFVPHSFVQPVRTTNGAGRGERDKSADDDGPVGCQHNQVPRKACEVEGGGYGKKKFRGAQGDQRADVRRISPKSVGGSAQQERGTGWLSSAGGSREALASVPASTPGSRKNLILVPASVNGPRKTLVSPPLATPKAAANVPTAIMVCNPPTAAGEHPPSHAVRLGAISAWYVDCIASALIGASAYRVESSGRRVEGHREAHLAAVLAETFADVACMKVSAACGGQLEPRQRLISDPSHSDRATVFEPATETALGCSSQTSSEHGNGEGPVLSRGASGVLADGAGDNDFRPSRDSALCEFVAGVTNDGCLGAVSEVVSTLLQPLIPRATVEDDIIPTSPPTAKEPAPPPPLGCVQRNLAGGSEGAARKQGQDQRHRRPQDAEDSVEPAEGHVSNSKGSQCVYTASSAHCFDDLAAATCVLPAAPHYSGARKFVASVTKKGRSNAISKVAADAQQPLPSFVKVGDARVPPSTTPSTKARVSSPPRLENERKLLGVRYHAEHRCAKNQGKRQLGPPEVLSESVDDAEGDRGSSVIGVMQYLPSGTSTTAEGGAGTTRLPKIKVRLPVTVVDDGDSEAGINAERRTSSAPAASTGRGKTQLFHLGSRKRFRNGTIVRVTNVSFSNTTVAADHADLDADGRSSKARARAWAGCCRPVLLSKNGSPTKDFATAPAADRGLGMPTAAVPQQPGENGGGGGRVVTPGRVDPALPRAAKSGRATRGPSGVAVEMVRGGVGDKSGALLQLRKHRWGSLSVDYRGHGAYAGGGGSAVSIIITCGRGGGRGRGAAPRVVLSPRNAKVDTPAALSARLGSPYLICPRGIGCHIPGVRGSAGKETAGVDDDSRTANFGAAVGGQRGGAEGGGGGGYQAKSNEAPNSALIKSAKIAVPPSPYKDVARAHKPGPQGRTELAAAGATAGRSEHVYRGSLRAQGTKNVVSRTKLESQGRNGNGAARVDGPGGGGSSSCGLGGRGVAPPPRPPTSDKPSLSTSSLRRSSYRRVQMPSSIAVTIEQAIDGW